jgi:hypothetical protein
MVLSSHRTETAHLPEQPFHHRLASSQIGRQEAPDLLGKVGENCARLENGDGVAPVDGTGIDNCGHPVVRRKRQEFGFELVAGADIDRMDPVGEPRLFKKHRDFVTVWRRPIIEFDHLPVLRIPAFWMPGWKPVSVWGTRHRNAYCNEPRLIHFRTYDLKHNPTRRPIDDVGR